MQVFWHLLSRPSGAAQPSTSQDMSSLGSECGPNILFPQVPGGWGGEAGRVDHATLFGFWELHTCAHMSASVLQFVPLQFLQYMYTSDMSVQCMYMLLLAYLSSDDL